MDFCFAYIAIYIDPNIFSYDLDRELFSISLYRIAEELGRTDFLK